MIRLDRVDKYFFRRKKNEIHAIDQTSLELSDTGLVAFLGPSGCGKTTLLNAIGGLDRVDGGKIYIDGERITGRLSGKVDQIRTLKVGYIFQNYNLLDHKTVSENVALALNMLGVKNKREVDMRVDYVLDKVGMYRYRNRFADMLSGGERQRVGIARAIVQNPQVIIADEPTGNLDSRNTLEVMNIIKSISRERLVILVTHEEELANYYADRIIRIQDGKVVSDVMNQHAAELDYRVDNRYYLKDIPDHQRLCTDRYDVHFYNKGGNVRLNILVDGGNIYIQSTGPNQNIEVVDDSSAVEMLDDHDRGMTEEEIQRQSVDLHKLDTFVKKRYTSILNPISLFRQGFKTISSYPLVKKLLLIGFFFSAAVITISTTLFFGVFNIPDSKFTTAEKGYVVISGEGLTTDVYEQMENDERVKYMLPGDSQVNMKIGTDDLIQTRSVSLSVDGSLSDIQNVKNVIAGRLPKNEHEVVIDKMVIRKLTRNGNDYGITPKNIGLSTYEDYLGRQLTVPNVEPYTIVGISDREVPCIYAYQGQFVDIISNAVDPDSEFEDAGDYAFEEDTGMEGEVTEAGEVTEMNVVDMGNVKDVGLFEGGNWPKAPYEVLVNFWPYKDSKTMKVGNELNQKVNGHKLKVVGFYSDKHPNSNYALATEETVKLATIEKKKKATLYPAGAKSDLKDLLLENGFEKYTDVYKRDREQYLEEQRSLMISVLVFSGIMILISFIEIFLMIRASFLSRIKEVGTYRAIGVKKRDIYKMFSGEILGITAIASLPGFLFATLIVTQLANNMYYADHFMVNPGTLLVSLIAIVALNLFFGLIPVARTIRKSPAAILARSDVQ